MSLNVTAKKIKIKGFGLVRDKYGKPKIDDYKNCPDEIKAMLTTKEKEELEKCL